MNKDESDIGLEQYFVVFFDYDNNSHNEEQIVKGVMERLRTFYYKNLSLKLSNNVLLIRVFKDNLRSSIEINIDDALSEQSSELKSDNYKIRFFVIPVNLKDIQSHLSGFENEMEYLKSQK